MQNWQIYEEELMRLINLTLNNFKGVKEFALDADGQSVIVYGDNATGKTTLADAQCWLLFNKDSKETKNFSPKTKDENGEDLHNVENIVEGTYLIDGVKVTFKKVFSEIWKKKRGSATSEFSGHTTDYYIDGVPVKANEYADRVNLLPQQTLLALSSPTYFAEELPISQRREMLMEIVGDVTDYEVIESNEDLKELKEYLIKPMTTSQYYGVDEYFKIAKSRLTEINKDLNSMPTRIDEAQKAMPEPVDGASVEGEIALLTIEKQKLTDKLTASQGEKLAENRTKIAELKAELLESESAHKQKYSTANDVINEDIKAVISKRNVSTATVDKLKSDLIRQEFKIKTLNEDRNELLKKHAEISKSTWCGDESCPTCGQDLPATDVEKAKERFNLDKSNKLLALNQKGKETCSKDIIADAENKLSEIKKSIESENTKIEGYLSEIEKLEDKLIATPPFNETEQYQQINNKITLICDEMERIKTAENTSNTAVNLQIEEIEKKLETCSDKKASIKLIETQKERIAELEKQQKQLGVEYEKVTKGVYLCEQFTRTKVSMLTDNINSRFNNVKFRLFTEQINGGLKEDCEPLVPSVNGLIPFAYANNAARVNAGLDIIRTLSEHYKISMPVFVDNAESVTQLDDADLQIIKLVVSAEDKKLRMENMEV